MLVKHLKHQLDKCDENSRIEVWIEAGWTADTPERFCIKRIDHYRDCDNKLVVEMIVQEN